MSKESEITVPGNWFQVDFHVHSPSSNDFQGIGKEESGYIWLLEQAKASEIDVIVITDHNDIAGYLKLIEIENDLRRTKRTLERTNSQIPESILEQISLFEQVVALPGIELDVYPNIHFVIVFDPQKTDEISSFLDNAGFLLEFRGEENSSKFCKWSIEQALLESEKLGAIVIAAHVDSDKGLYEASKKWGQNRIAAFCNENLYGMEFINPIARDQIESIMKTPDYARNTRLVFVQSSDFHGKPGQKVGERRTFIRMDDLEKQDKNNVFQALKRALRNPDEFVSAPGRPELQAIFRKLEDKLSIETIQNDEDKNRLAKSICAYANTEDGTIVIGRNIKGNWIGQSENNENDFEEKILGAVKLGIMPQPRIALQIYPYYGSNYIASLRVRKHPQLCVLNSDDRIYLLKSGEPKPATSKEIVDLVESRFIERYAHLSITSKLSDMSQKLLGTEDSIDILSIVRKIDNNSVLMGRVFGAPKFGVKIPDEKQDGIEISENGCADGNITVLTYRKPRFDKAYLRITAPIGVCCESEKHFDETSRFSGEKILIVPGGGVYYDTHENIIVACDLYPPMVFSKISMDYTAGIKFVVAYLKSSLAIWYAERCLGSYDIRKSIIFNLPIPNKVDSECKGKVEKLIDDIMQLEYDFLNAETNLFNENTSKEARESTEFQDLLNKMIQNHNSTSNALVSKIDKIFYEFFGLSEKEISIVEQVLKALRFAVFPDTSAPN